MNKIIILYHSGVGSTKLMSYKIKDMLEDMLSDTTVDIENIEEYTDYLKLKTYDMMVFGFPLRNSAPSKTFMKALGRLPVSLDKIPCAIFTTCDFLPGNSLKDVSNKLKTKNYFCIESTYFKTPSPKFCIKAPFLSYFKRYETHIERKVSSFCVNISSQLKKKAFIHHEPPFRAESILQKPIMLFKPSVERAYINYSVCDKCGKCVDLCPQHCYTLNAEGYPIRNPKGCESCLRCIHYCPTRCISLDKNRLINYQLKDTVLQELLEASK